MKIDKLQIFFYHLMRDKLTCGDIESLVQQSENIKVNVIFSNKYLADYAKQLSERLRK